MPDLRAAAERLMLDLTTTVSPDYDSTPDIRLVCGAILAEHPADDAEPITEDWLRSVGFKRWDLSADIETFDLFIPMQDEIGWKCRLAYQSNGFYAARLAEDEDLGVSESVELLGTRNRSPAVTRGDVRRLARCLGVKLKE